MSGPVSLNLRHKQELNLKQHQRLIMSPQMQQALHLLQAPILELSTMIDQELEINPVLEYLQENETEEVDLVSDAEEEGAGDLRDVDQIPNDDEKELAFEDLDFELLKRLHEDSDWSSDSETPSQKRTLEEDKEKTFQENSICAEASLFEFLMEQARTTFDEADDIALAEILIGSFDDHGYLQTPLHEIAVLSNSTEDKLQAILATIQTFDPSGIGATNTRESLLIQMRCKGKQSTLAYEIIEKHYDDLLHNHIPSIQKSLRCSALDISNAVEQYISKLDLNPAASHSHEAIQQIVPDVTIRQEEERLIVATDDDRIPGIRLNKRYMRMLEDETVPIETKEFIREKIMSAKWLIHSIFQRNETIKRIVETLAVKQSAFFLSPDGKLEPLTMKTIAEELELHESTIARAVANKYVDCPRGLLPLRSFFTNAYATDEGYEISSDTVRDVLQEIIDKENKKKPLSDIEISGLIKTKGISCARRTVAKYRNELKIGNAFQRRDYTKQNVIPPKAQHH